VLVQLQHAVSDHHSTAFLCHQRLFHISITNYHHFVCTILRYQRRSAPYNISGRTDSHIMAHYPTSTTLNITVINKYKHRVVLGNTPQTFVHVFCSLKTFHVFSSLFLITGSTVAQPCVNSHWLSQWEPSIFDPPQNRRPLNDRKIFVTGDYDYVHYFYICVKFGGNPSMGGFWANR